MIPATAIVALWAVAFLFLFRIPDCGRVSAAGPRPSVSVIVPARNEAHNLPRLLASLKTQDLQPEQVIVVDDGSTDATADVAREAGVEVLVSQPLPDGWRGKAWACFQGARAADAEVLLFVDSDTSFEDGGLNKVLGAFSARGGALSLVPYHRVERPYEELSAFFNILMAAGTSAFSLGRSGNAPAGFFGPFLMTEREAYWRCGGHEAVRGKILEHFHIARVFRRHGLPTRCLSGKGCFSIRMYPDGLGGLVEGWTKAFASGAVESPVWVLVASVAWFIGLFLAVYYPIAGLAAPSMPRFVTGTALYLLFAFQVHGFLRRLGSFRLLTALLYPVPLVFYQAVFMRSLLRQLLGRKVSWKGRNIDVDKRGR